MNPLFSTKSRSCWYLSAVAILLGLFPSLIKLLYYPHNIGSDDAYIHLQVARNVVSGHGWGLNLNAPENLSSSPAFTSLLILISLLTSHVISAMQVLSSIASFVGLLLIYLTVRLETNSEFIALISEASAALSCNLWRWNGTVMEATIAFFIVSLLMFQLSQRRLDSQYHFILGVISGLATLLRPELLLAAFFCVLVIAVRVRSGRKVVSVGIFIAGVAVTLAPWIAFARANFNAYLPTTFYAKSIPHLIVWNQAILKQMLELTGESFLWPTLLISGLFIRLLRSRLEIFWQAYLLPAGLLLSVTSFYYLKTPGLESPGRYMLPFLPCAAVLLGLISSDSAFSWNHILYIRMAMIVVVLQLATSLVINQVYLAPILASFESEYGESMRSAADFIAHRVHSPNESVLVEVDVGLLAYRANGRFRIYDGGGLASPELIHLAPADQVQAVQPDYVIESQGDEAAEWNGKDGGRLRSIWHRRYRQHSISQSIPYLFANIYSSSLNQTKH
jgi:hypothetical protein